MPSTSSAPAPTPVIHEAEAISFPIGTTARVLHVDPGADGEEVLQRLRLPTPRATMVLNGSTEKLSPELEERLRPVVGEGLAGLALKDVIVLTGATDVGVFSILGAAMEGRSAPLVGVAPDGLVTWPDRAPGPMRYRKRPRVDLEPHHSHLVLVEGAEWGVETPVLLALATALGTRAPSVVVLSGGGHLAREEALGHARVGRPMVVLAGSGRLADELALAVEAGGADEPNIAEIVQRGNVTVCPLSAGPAALAAAVRVALG